CAHDGGPWITAAIAAATANLVHPTRDHDTAERVETGIGHDEAQGESAFARQNGRGMADLSPGSELAGCRIEEVLGTGGMGVIYRAPELRLGRPVALKLIAADGASDPALRERFEREARLTASIDHPNVIPVYAAGEENGHLYLVMRYVPGTDLHRVLRREG